MYLLHVEHFFIVTRVEVAFLQELDVFPPLELSLLAHDGEASL